MEKKKENNFEFGGARAGLGGSYLPGRNRRSRALLLTVFLLLYFYFIFVFPTLSFIRIALVPNYLVPTKNIYIHTCYY